MEKNYNIRKLFLGLVGACVLAGLAGSCAGGSEVPKAAEFSSVEKITCDSIPIKQIVQPTENGWHIAGDKSVFVSPKSDSLFWVYRLPDFKYLYSFGLKGEGPDDYWNPILVPDVSGKGHLIVSQYGKGIDIALEDNASQVVSRRSYGRYIRPEMVVSDSVALIRFGIYGRESRLYEMVYFTVNLYTDGMVAPIDSLRPVLYNKDTKLMPVEGGYRSSGQPFNIPLFVQREGGFILVSPDTWTMDFYTVSPQGKIALEKTVGQHLSQKEMDELNLSERQTGQQIFRAQAGEKYLYLFINDYQNMGTWRKTLNAYLEVYDMEGRPVKKFDLGRPFTCFLADEAHGKIYCYHSGYDLEYVYVYDIDI